MKDTLKALIDDYDKGLLTGKLLKATPCAPNGELIEAEILKLDRMIDDARARGHNDLANHLCIAFQALNWARAGTEYFAPPSSMVAE